MTRQFLRTQQLFRNLQFLRARHEICGGTAISEDMFQWIPRDFNQIADDLADTGCLVENRIIENKIIKSNTKCFRVYFDGSAQDGNIGGGWCLE